jgi:hypothetical protein
VEALMGYLHLFLALLCLTRTTEFHSGQKNEDIQKLLYFDDYNPHILSKVYYSSLDVISLVAAIKLEQMLAFIGSPVWITFGFPEGEPASLPKCYGLIMLDMVEKNQLEFFQCLYRLIDFEDQEEEDYSIYLMVECLSRSRWDFLDFMISQNFDAETFHPDIVKLIENIARPKWGIRLVGWIASHNETVSARQTDIYSELIFSLLRNSRLEENEVLGLIEEVIKLGAIVDDGTVDVFRKRFPDNATFCETLQNAQIPDAKEPSDC